MFNLLSLIADIAKIEENKPYLKIKHYLHILKKVKKFQALIRHSKALKIKQ